MFWYDFFSFLSHNVLPSIRALFIFTGFFPQGFIFILRHNVIFIRVEVKTNSLSHVNLNWLGDFG